MRYTLQAIQSYPTPPAIARTEWVNGNFLKLHPGPPVHYFLDCKDTDYHTHPWVFESHIILGGYREEVVLHQPDGSWLVETIDRLPGTSHRMPADVPHKLIGLLDGPCMTRCEYFERVAGERWGICRFDEDGQLLHRYSDEKEWHLFAQVNPILSLS